MNQLKAGATISYLSLGINIITGLLYTPWMINSIGRTNFGLYTLAMSVISLFVFDFGLSAAVTRFIAKYLAMDRQDLANKCLGLVYKLYIYIDIVLFLALVIVYFFIPQIYEELTPDEIERFKVVYSIVAVYSVLSFPFIPVNGILTAHEKIVQLKLADIFQKLFIVGTMTACLLLDYGLYALVLINAVAGLLCIIFKLVCIKRYTKQTVAWSYSSKTELKSLASYSGWVTVIALAQRCIFNLAPTILGITSGTVSIAILGIAMTIEGYCFTFANALNGIFLPKVMRILIKEDGNILPLMIRVGRIQLLVIAFIIIGFICFGNQFIYLWVGEDFKASYICAVLLIIPSLFHLPQTIGSEAIYAQNKVKQLAIVFVVMAICNIIGAFILSPSLGALGICISICFVYLIRTIGFDLILWKQIKINICDFFRSSFGSLLPSLLGIVLIGFIIAYLIHPGTWFKLIIDIILFAIVYWGALYVFGMNSEEKNLIMTPFRRFLRFCK